jgi:hypothetical protein
MVVLLMLRFGIDLYVEGTTAVSQSGFENPQHL